MSAASTCPGADVLEQLCRGRLPLPEVEHVARHLETCPRCVELVQQLPLADDLATDLHAQAGQRVDSLSPVVQAVLKHWRERVASQTTESGQQLERLPQVPGYDILETIGRGGMGVVYRARQVQLNRLVALKMVRAGPHAGEDELHRFAIEAEAVARLQHPSIVQIFDFGQHEGLPFFAMELIPGGSLAERLQSTPLPAREAAALVQELAQGVQHAHDRGIVHRDLKPANVLLVSDGAVSGESSEYTTTHHSPLTVHHRKIADFGLARLATSGSGVTASGAIMGTPSYMAPEQAAGKGKEAGPGADTYSLGAILYECLTGRPPFKAASPMDTLLQVLTEEPVPPSRLNAQVPRDLETICLKCLQKQPSKRYLRVADLGDDLGRFLRGEPIRARPIGKLHRAWRWCRRNPRLAAAMSVAAAALLATTLLALSIARADRLRLWESLLAQARAQRQVGDRWEALATIGRAADILRTAELRQDAIETITSSGIRLVKEASGRMPLEKISKRVKDGFGQVNRDTLRRPFAEFGFPNIPSAVVGKWSKLGFDPRRPDRFDKDLWVANGDGFLDDNSDVEIFIVSKHGELSRVFLHDWRKDTYVEVREAGGCEVFRLSGDNSWLAFVDRTDADLIRLYDCRRQRPHGRLDGRGEAAMLHTWLYPGAQFSSDNQLFASNHWRGGRPVMQIDEVPSCRPIKAIPGATGVTWSSDGRFLLSLGTGFTGLAEEPERELDKTYVEYLHYKNNHVKLPFAQVWEVAAPAPAYQLREAIERLTFRSDGRQLIVNRTLWDVASTGDWPVLRQTEIEIPDGQLQFRGAEVWAVRAVDPRPLNTPERTHAVLARLVAGPLGVGTSPATAPLAALGSHVLGMCVLEWHPPPIERLVPRGRGTRLAPPDHSAELAAAWKEMRAESNKPIAVVPCALAEQFAWQPEGTRLFGRVAVKSRYWGKYNSGDGELLPGSGGLVCWDTEAGRVIRENDPFMLLDGIVFQPDGRRFVTVGVGLLKLWDGDTASVVKTFPEDPVRRCSRAAWSQDGKFLAGVDGNRLDAWNWQPPSHPFVLEIDTGRVHRLPTTGAKWTTFALSPDAGWLGTGGDDGLLRLMDVQTGKELAHWQGHEAAVSALAFEPEGRLLVSGARDGTIRVWNLPWIREELTRLGLNW
jgi:serine/threonine protein kinase